MDLAQLLDDLGGAAELRVFALKVASQQSVHAERQAGYVSLRPGSGGPIAFSLIGASLI